MGADEVVERDDEQDDVYGRSGEYVEIGIYGELDA